MARRIEWSKNNYKPGWLSQIDLRINHIRGAILDMQEITKASDEILIDSEVGLVNSFTEEIEEFCAKLLKEVFKINPDWEIVLNPEREWWLDKDGTNRQK